MCVTKKNECRCCKGCSLTNVTYMIGAMYLAIAITCAALRLWLPFSFNMLVSVSFLVIVIKRYNAGAWHLLFKLYLGLETGSWLGYLFTMLFIFESSWQRDWCEVKIKDYNFTG